MKRLLVVTGLVCGLFLFHHYAEGQYNVPTCVLGTGGTVATGGSYGIVGTLGQTLIGGANSPANNTYAGFWYQPSPVMTGAEPIPGKGLPTEYLLQQNYPNPFNPSTTIKYELPTSSMVRLSVYDMLAREVSVLVDERRDAGVHEVTFDVANLASGVYVYRLQAGEFQQSRKMMLLR